MAQTFDLCCSQPHYHLRNAATGHIDGTLMGCRWDPDALDLCRNHPKDTPSVGLRVHFFWDFLLVTIFGTGAAEIVSFLSVT